MGKLKRLKKKGKIQITMDRKFSEFKKDEKRNFEKDLSEVAKTDKKDIKEKKYKRGCVFFEGKLDQIIIDELLHKYENGKVASSNDHSVEMNAFVKKYSIKQMCQKPEIDIITSRKGYTTQNLIRSDNVASSKPVGLINGFHLNSKITFNIILNPLFLNEELGAMLFVSLSVPHPLTSFKNYMIR